MHAGPIPRSTNESVEYLLGYLDCTAKGPQTLAVRYSSAEEFAPAAVFSWSRTGANVDRRVNAAVDQLMADNAVLASSDDTSLFPWR